MNIFRDCSFVRLLVSGLVSQRNRSESIANYLVKNHKFVAYIFTSTHTRVSADCVCASEQNAEICN